MAVQATPYVVTALSHSAELFRRTLQAGLPIGSAGGIVGANAATNPNLTAGVSGSAELQVTAPASGMSVNIYSGQVIVPGSLGSGLAWGMPVGYGYPAITLNGGSAPTIASNANATQIQLTTQGAYYCYNDDTAGAVNLAVSASNPTNPRIDVVGAQVEDAAYSGSNNDWKLTVVTGTAAASPTVPTFPANFIPLALVWVPANATNIVAGDIIDLRVTYNRNPFHAEMYRNAAYTQSSAGAVTHPWDTITSDLTGSCTTGAAAKFTCPVSGLYLLNSNVNPSALVSADRYTYNSAKNGTTTHKGDDITAANTAGTVLSIVAVERCAKGDALSTQFDSVTSTSTGFGVGANALNHFEVTLLSPI